MPDETPSQDLVIPRLRIMQIITGALMTGVAVFLVLVLVLQQQGQFPVPAPQTPLISILAAGEFVVIFGVWLIYPPIFVRQGLVPIARRTPDPTAETNALLALKQTSLIVASALLEGSAFFALIAYLLEKQPYALGVALACLLLLLITFPTHVRVKQWLAEQQERLEILRRPD